MRNQELNIPEVRCKIDEYFEKHRTPFKAKTLSQKIGISPKQTRFILRIYYTDNMIKKKLSAKRYYLKK
jgi:hypothetical protein